jgi:hypothetical protein
MLFNSEYRYYEFFFTHLGQSLVPTQEGLKMQDWIRVNFEHADQDLYESNALTLFISDSTFVNSDPGNLTINVFKGILKLDTSIPLSNNIELYDTNTTSFPIIDYTRIFYTPLKFEYVPNYEVLNYSFDTSLLLNNSNEDYTSDNNNIDITEFSAIISSSQVIDNYSYKIQDQTYNGSYAHQYWKLEKASTYINPETNYSWKGFTIDSNIYNNQINIGEDEFNVPFKVDTYSYFIKNAPGEQETKNNLLTTDLLPFGLTTLEYKNVSAVSKTWTSFKRGYTPADDLREEMKSGSTINVAIGLLTLVELKEDRMIVLLIRELTHLWKYVLNNVVSIDGVEELNSEAIPGFPPNIPRVVTDSIHPCYLEERRTTLDNAWIGYALSKASTYLADRKVDERITLSNDVARMLEQLAQFTAGCISPATGLATPGYDSFGYLIAEYDYEASVMASLFLRSYLTINYSNFIHGRVASLKLNLDSIYELDGIAELNTRLDSNLIRIYTYLVIYAFVNNYQYRLLDITTKLVEALTKVDLTTTNVSIKDITLAEYVLSRAKIIYNDTSTLLNNYLDNIEVAKEIDKGIYVREEETYPSLLTSSLTILEELNVDIFNNYYFDLLEAEAELLTSIWYNSGLRLYPYGYGWLKEEQLRTTNSAVGALIYSAAYSTFDTACYISLLKSSVRITNSQGSLLNAWGASIRRPRPLFMSDFYYREYIANEMLNPLSLVSSLSSYINNNFSEDIAVYNPELPKTIYSLINNMWTELEIGTSDYTAALLKGNSIEPGFYKKNGNNYEFVKWYDYNGRVYVASVGYYKGLSKEVIKSLSTGVKSSITYYLPFVTFNNDLGYFTPS